MELSDDKNKQASLAVAEDSRQTEWQFPSFVAELFKGHFRWHLMHAFPTQSPEDKAIGDAICEKVKGLLKKHVDPDKIDKEESISKETLSILAENGLFGIKISKEYGGLGLSVFNYARLMELIGSWCGSTAVWLSAHQSIGVPQPLKLFGTKEQKEKFLPRLAKGAISAFALTEPSVGSDPSKMETTATLNPEGTHYSINGEKLWITNGPAAELIVVMAVTPPKMVNGKEKKQITAFIVETNTPGFEVVHRCSFLGIRAIENGLLHFKNVLVPKENMIGKEGMGLKIALETLNTGRLTIPAVSTGVGKLCLRYAKKWSNERVQWGAPIGQHQEVGKKLAEMAGYTYAMESMSYITAAYADKKNADIRLEAAMSKYFGSEASWHIADETLQVRGGRGFETAQSLAARGEDPIPVERMLRDLRINRIIEGTSEIMRLFIAREAMDVHLKFILTILNPKKPLSKRLKTCGLALRFYITWYPLLWIPRLHNWKTTQLSFKNRNHLRYISRTSRKLARSMFHTMARYQTKLEKEQLILAQFVDIGTELFAMASTLSHAEFTLNKTPSDRSSDDLADYFCTAARLRIKQHFRALKCNDFKKVTAISKQVLEGDFDWLDHGVMGL